jgi:hypothetical protein
MKDAARSVVAQATGGSASKTWMLWDELLLTLVNFPPEIMKELTFPVKKMETVNYKRKTVHTVEEEYEAVHHRGILIVKTHQGFWRRVMNWSLQRGFMPEIIDLRVKDLLPPPQLGMMQGFRFSQKDLLMQALTQGISGGIEAPTRYGKCFGRGTPVMMADGSVRPVENIKTGDFVMGPDSKPRKVAGCTQGQSKLYRVVPNYKGMSWICNEDHILHVQRVKEDRREGWNKAQGATENIPVLDWLGATKWFRHVRKMRRVATEFPPADLEIPPYIYGLWLGDGHSEGISFTNMEPEVWAEIAAWGSSVGLVESGNTQQSGKASTRRWVKTLGTGKTKRGENLIRQWFREFKKTEGIRPEYLRSSREQRLELLAGLLDTDGESSGETNCGFISKHQKLSEDFVALCNSLGFGAMCNPSWKKAQTGPKRCYWRVSIRGNSDVIPFRVPRKIRTRKNKFNCLTVGFKVEEAGYGDYFGFALEDPEGLFLLSDGTVVHNSTLIENILRAWPGVQTVLTMPGIDLLKQQVKALQKALPDREIKLIGGGSKVKFQSEDINVVSMDSLHLIDGGPVHLFIADEPHALIAESRFVHITRFKWARKYWIGATPDDRYDKRGYLLEGLIGPPLAVRTYREARAEGAVANIKVALILWEYDPLPDGDRDKSYARLLHLNERVGAFIRYLSNQVIPKEWQTLVFIDNEKQADMLSEMIGRDISVAMAKKLTNKEREAMTARVERNHITRAICSSIFIQGVTFHDLMVLVNAAGGGSSTSTIQRPGRVAEIRSGKSDGWLVDFLFTQNPKASSEAKKHDKARSLMVDSLARKEAYEKKGYEVHVVRPEGVLEWFLAQKMTPPDNRDGISVR